ncbi:MAG TPA: hypothetical protein VM513_25585 [Kofleriaceae bacterium]|jgi:hypothetical protein|nr:hypothetical protein [Kofleriaceae bacterium]
MSKATMFVITVAALTACGGSKDKCERLYDRMAPLMEAQGKKEPRAEAVAKCHQDIKEAPGKERMIDCLLAIEGELTPDKLIRCANTDKYPKTKHTDENKAAPTP